MQVFLLITSILLGVIFLYITRKFSSMLYLALFILLIGFYEFIQYAVFTSGSVLLKGLIFMNVGFLAGLTGPLFYFYVRSVLTDSHRLSRKDVWHFVPALLFLIFTLPYILSPWSFKMEIAGQIAKNSNFTEAFHVPLLIDFISGRDLLLGYPVLMGCYATWSFILIIRYLKHQQETSVFKGQRFMIQWLFTLPGFLMVVAVSNFMLIMLVSQMTDSESVRWYNFLQNLILAWLSGLVLATFIFPGLLYGIPRFQKDWDDWDKAVIPGVEHGYLNFIQRKTDSFMEKHRPYLHSHCNLSYYSKITGIPAHHIACYFKYVRKQTFDDFRNRWRVEHAKKLILEGRVMGLPLKEIGYLSGFLSRHRFLMAFKKTEGKSIGDFILQNNK